MRVRITAILLSLVAVVVLVLPQAVLAEASAEETRRLAEEAAALARPVTEAESGVFAGVTTACWKQGTCSLCDALVVGINISNSILRLLAILATIFFVYGAGLMMLSQGNEDYVSRGKATMKATIVGVIITICAWQIMSIVVFVLANAQAENANNLAVFEGTEEARKQPAGNTYNPITSWFTIAEVCNQGNQHAAPASTTTPTGTTPDPSSTTTPAPAASQGWVKIRDTQTGRVMDVESGQYNYYNDVAPGRYQVVE